MDLKQFLMERLSKEVESSETENAVVNIESEEKKVEEAEVKQPAEEELNEEESIKSEDEFRAAAEAKFKAVFGDKLDKDKMKETIDGLLKDNKEDVEAGNWGKLIGVLNKSFGK